MYRKLRFLKIHILRLLLTMLEMMLASNFMIVMNSGINSLIGSHLITLHNLIWIFKIWVATIAQHGAGIKFHNSIWTWKFGKILVPILQCDKKKAKIFKNSYVLNMLLTMLEIMLASNYTIVFENVGKFWTQSPSVM